MWLKPVLLVYGIASILLLLLFSCATNNISDSQKGVRNHIVRDIPFYPQEEYQCGPASLASILNYRGAAVTPEEVAKKIYSQTAKGTLTVDMVLYANSKGLEASHYSGGLDDLRKKIDSDQPLIVLVDYGFSIVQANHFMVVVGYNDYGVIVNSGKNEKKFIPSDDFLKSWERTKFWTLLITREK